MPSTLPRLAIVGAGGHALAAAEVVDLAGAYEIVGFLDEHDRSRWGGSHAGRPILGGCDRLDRLRQAGVAHALVAIGDCGARLRVAQLVAERGFSLAIAVHPRAFVSPSASLGGGTLVMPGAVVQAACQIGANAIVNTGATVDHECVVADGAHVGPGVHLGGRVRVGRGTWLGIGAVVSDRLTIGAGSVVGAGAVVLGDVPAGVVAYGVPARVIREVDHRT